MATARGGPLGLVDNPLRQHLIALQSWQRAALLPRRQVLPLLLTLAGAACRIGPWLRAFPLHKDEALYGFWAKLIASHTDPLLLTVWVDKPPLVLYMLAASLSAFGSSELALRLPGMIASILTIPVVYGMARRAYTRQTALLAGLIAATCPFAILFAPTAFTDPWVALWLAVAGWSALAGRPLWAGVATGLGVASKQQGALIFGLVVPLLALRAWDDMDRGIAGARGMRERIWTFGRYGLIALAGFIAVFGPVTYWDSLRWATRPSFWDQGLSTYGGLSLAPPSTWSHRWAGWSRQIGYLFGTRLVTTLALLLAAVAGTSGLWRGRASRPAQPGVGTMKRTSRIDLILGLYLGAYLALHFFLTFQAWDRYLLPVVPLICILAARGVGMIWEWLSRASAPGMGRVFFALAGSFLLLQAARLGVAGTLPVGSDHGAFDGIDQVVSSLRIQPGNAVIYHHWLGWHYDFYLFDAPQERRWWDTAWKLADDAAQTSVYEPERTQWIVLPGWEDAAALEIRTALASRGLNLKERRRIRRADSTRAFTIYEITKARKPHGREESPTSNL